MRIVKLTDDAYEYIVATLEAKSNELEDDDQSQAAEAVDKILDQLDAYTE